MTDEEKLAEARRLSGDARDHYTAHAHAVVCRNELWLDLLDSGSVSITRLSKECGVSRRDIQQVLSRRD